VTNTLAYYDKEFTTVIRNLNVKAPFANAFNFFYVTDVGDNKLRFCPWQVFSAQSILTLTNPLPYYTTVLFNTVKSFIVQDTDTNTNKMREHKHNPEINISWKCFILNRT